MNGRTNTTPTVINGALIPLETPTNISLVSRDSCILISWEDPVDKYSTPGNEIVSSWKHSAIIRKIGDYPASISDGVTVIKTATRNQYKDNYYTDAGLVNGTKYYYAIFAVTEGGIASDPLTGSETPTAAVPEYVGQKSLQNQNYTRGVAITNNDDYYVLSGGGSEFSPISNANYITAYDHDETAHLVGSRSPSNSVSYQSAGSLTGYAIFYCGTPSTSISSTSYVDGHAISNSLTMSKYFTGSNLDVGHNACVTSLDDVIIFAGQAGAQVSYDYTAIVAVDTSLTERSLFGALGTNYVHPTGASNGTYAVYNGASNNGSSHPKTVKAVNQSGTHLDIATAPSDSNESCAISFNRCAIFAGGKTGTSPGTTHIYSVNESLTYALSGDLITPRWGGGGFAFDNCAVLLGGSRDGYTTQDRNLPVELIDASFTVSEMETPTIITDGPYISYSGNYFQCARVDNKVFVSDGQGTDNMYTFNYQ